MLAATALPFLIPITAMIGAFAIGIVAMILKSKAKERQHRERMFMAEKGIEIPRELYDIQEPKRNDFRRGRAWLMILGILCVFIGISAVIALTVQEGFYQGVGGLVPIFIGFGFLVAERMITKFIVGGNKK